MNQRYLFVNKGHFMKLMKHLFSSLFIAGAMLSTQALAEEKTSEQAQPQMLRNNLLYKHHHKRANKR